MFTLLAGIAHLQGFVSGGKTGPGHVVQRSRRTQAGTQGASTLRMALGKIGTYCPRRDLTLSDGRGVMEFVTCGTIAAHHRKARRVVD
jgi:hypothetical protein